MIYILIVLLMGILSFPAMASDSWVIFGWIHYFGGSAITFLLMQDAEYLEEREENNE